MLDNSTRIIHMRPIIETSRLILRELEEADFSSLRHMLQDEEVMYAYEGAFTDDMVKAWYDRQLTRYAETGYGLWSLVEKETGRWIGQCGLTLQDFNGVEVLEVGYLLCKEYWGNGYATEAARACMDYAFGHLGVKEVYSIIRDDNIASQRVAERNGLKKVGILTKYYRDVFIPHNVYAVSSHDYYAHVALS